MKIFKHTTISQHKTVPNTQLKEIKELYGLIFPHALAAWEGQAYMVDMLTASLVMQDPAKYGPQLKRCKFVSSELYSKLSHDPEFTKNYSVRYIDTYQITEHGKDTHAFIIITSQQTGKKYLFDAQYQQFVNEQFRNSLPEIMIFEFTDSEDLIAGLKKHRVQETNHKWWLQAEELKKLAA
ncbi:MAG: hypothetical protein HYZ79_01950 [Candidatus Melainabacteria bacterium]|nr:hypothetical protein [Candidatus Melainabacteria bacterium]